MYLCFGVYTCVPVVCAHNVPICVHVYLCMCVCMPGHMYIPVPVHTRASMCVHMFTCACEYMCLGACVYTRVPLCGGVGYLRVCSQVSLPYLGSDNDSPGQYPKHRALRDRNPGGFFLPVEIIRFVSEF